MKTLFFFILAATMLLRTQSFAQVSINSDNSAPHTSAMLDVKSTDKGLLPPRMTYAQKMAIVNPADGLIVFCTDCNTNGALQIFFNGGWRDLTNSTGSLPPNCNIVDNYGFCYNEVLNPNTGKTWLDRNLGASRVAQAVDDYQAYGSLYQWGRLSDGHEKMNWTGSTAGTPINGTTTTLSVTDVPGHNLYILNSTASPYDWRAALNNNLWQGGGGINNPCPSGFRIPTSGELNEEAQSWSSPNSTGAFASPLKFTIAGHRWSGDGLSYDAGLKGYYWSSTVAGGNASRLTIQPASFLIGTNSRAYGFCVRCIKDNVLPAPTQGTHIPSQTQIIWNWASVAGATGYRWNTTNNYSTATDMGTNTTKTETGLTCNQTYNRFCWAYNVNGNSTVTALTQATSACGNSYPTVTTTAASNIEPTTATSGGNVTSDGGSTVTAKGVCWSTSPNPTTANSKTIDGTGVGTYTSQLTNLTPSTLYYIRAYATNSAGTAYGVQISFTTSDLYIGCNYGGGKVFYIDYTGVHGWISATSDQGTASWQGAIDACDNLTLNGYSDWYLPWVTIGYGNDQLVILCQNKNSVGGFFADHYWSHQGPEYGGTSDGYFVDFGTTSCSQGTQLKVIPKKYRCVRDF